MRLRYFISVLLIYACSIFWQSFTLLSAMNHQLSASNSKLNDHLLFILHSIKNIIPFMSPECSISRLFLCRYRVTNSLSFACVIVRFCLTNLILSVVLARVWLNMQTGRDGNVLIVKLNTIINCMCMYFTQGLELNEADTDSSVFFF